MGWAWSTTGSETITSATRVVALTWVHSGTGVTLPVAEIAAEIRSRAIALGIERLLFCLDSVPHLRLGESVLTSPDDVEAALRAIDEVR